MSEGTAREIVAKAAWEAYTGYVTRIPWDQANYFKRSGHERIADAVLAALREAGALAPAGLTADSFTERDLDTIGLAVWVTSTAMTERRFVGLDLIEKLQACGFDIVRTAPAADAATGAPS